LFFRYATILAFDVKVERDAQDLADSLGVKIFQADIIYHLFDKFMAYREELKQRKREQFRHIAVFPCKLKVLPQVRTDLHEYQYVLRMVVPSISWV
jgi:translation initiation factor 5B